MKKLICVVLILIPTLFFIQPVLLAREIAIDDTLRVELIDNKMSSEDAHRIFNYAKSTFYEHGKYEEAVKAFQTIIDYSNPNTRDTDISLLGKSFYRRNSNLRDDALFYIGKCYYHTNTSKCVETFEQLYHLFPDSSIVKSGQLQNTLINFLEQKNIDRSFYYIMRTYHFLTKNYPDITNNAKRIVEKRTKEYKTVTSWGRFGHNVKRSYRLAVEWCGGTDNKDGVLKVLGDRHGEDFADDVWEYFIGTKISLNYNQRKAITRLVKDNLYCEPYPCPDAYSNDPALVCPCEIKIKICFCDLLETAGIDLFDIGKRIESNI